MSVIDSPEDNDKEANFVTCLNCGKTVSKPFISGGKVFCSEHCFDEWNKKQLEEEKPLDKTVEEEAEKVEEKEEVKEELQKKEVLEKVEEIKNYYEGEPKVDYKEEEKEEEKVTKPYEDTDVALHKVKEERDPHEILKREHHVYKKDDMLDRMQERKEEQIKKRAGEQYKKEKEGFEKGEQPSSYENNK